MTSSSRPSWTASPSVFPGCLIQWEDFKQHNALRLLDRYRERVLLVQRRHPGHGRRRPWRHPRLGCTGSASGSPTSGSSIAGAGAAGIGIARLHPPGHDRGRSHGGGRSQRPSRWSIPTGSSTTGRPDLDPDKGESPGPARPRPTASATAGDAPAEPPRRGPRPAADDPPRRDRQPGNVRRAVIAALAGGVPSGPIVMPLSNPTTAAEANPADVLRWSDGRAIVATGSPFAPVELGGGRPRDRPGEQRLRVPGPRARGDRRRGADDAGRLFLVAARTLASR